MISAKVDNHLLTSFSYMFVSKALIKLDIMLAASILSAQIYLFLNKKLSKR